MRALRRSWPLVLFLLAGPAAGAQASDPPAQKRPGLFALGPFWLTPRLRLGTVGLDTNVFYTADDRHADFIFDGGPALEIALPTRPVRLDVVGGVNILYYARTPDQRRLSGDARARLTFVGQHLHASVEEGYSEAFDRPSFEVDERVDRGLWVTRGDLSVDLPGRLQARTTLSAERLDVPEGQEFMGADLHRTLERTTRIGVLGLGYRATPKTMVRVEGDLQLDRFPNAPSRDMNSNRVRAGFTLESQTRFSGTALVGPRFLRSTRPLGGEAQLWVAEAQLAWHFGPRTHARFDVRRDADISAFESASRLPLLRVFDARLQLDRELTPRIDLGLFVRHETLRSDALVTLVGDDGSVDVGYRDDRVWDTGLTLTQRVGRRLRAGFTVGYTTRVSSFADLGISGLMFGGTLNYVP